MKKLMFIFTLLLFLMGCDNNEGPFTSRMENGKKVLYSGDKLAKGWIEKTINDYNTGNNVKISEIYFDKGIPAGDFKLYSINGDLFVHGKGKWDKNKFKGIIKEPLISGKGEGIFNINSDLLISFNGDTGYSLAYKTMEDGKYVGAAFEFKRINNKYDDKYLGYYPNGSPKYNVDYKNGEKNGKYLEYYQNGSFKYDIDYKY